MYCLRLFVVVLQKYIIYYRDGQNAPKKQRRQDRDGFVMMVR